MGVKIAHVCHKRVPLVEGPPVVNECMGNFLLGVGASSVGLAHSIGSA